MKNIHFAVMLFSTTLVLSSCWRIDKDPDTDTSERSSTAEAIFDDLESLTEDASKENATQAQMKILYGDSVQFTVDPAWPDMTFPKTISIDFGDGVIGLDGNTRSGIITVVATGPYTEAGSTFTTTLDAYHIDEYHVQGTKIVTNNGLNDAGYLNYDIAVTEGSITNTDGYTTTWSSERNREWIGGQDTNWLTDGLEGVLDDTYSITGSATGVTASDRFFNFIITDPLIVSLNCHWIKQGVIELSPEGLNVRTLDYGNGECDNQATLSVNGNTYDITLW